MFESDSEDSFDDGDVTDSDKERFKIRPEFEGKAGRKVCFRVLFDEFYADLGKCLIFSQINLNPRIKLGLNYTFLLVVNSPITGLEIRVMSLNRI